MGIRRNYSEGNYSQKLIEMTVSHRFAPTVTHTHIIIILNLIK